MYIAFILAIFAVFVFLPAGVNQRLDNACKPVHWGGEAIAAAVRVGFSAEMSQDVEKISHVAKQKCVAAAWEWIYGAEYRAQNGMLPNADINYSNTAEPIAGSAAGTVQDAPRNRVSLPMDASRAPSK